MVSIWRGKSQRAASPCNRVLKKSAFRRLGYFFRTQSLTFQFFSNLLITHHAGNADNTDRERTSPGVSTMILAE